ncbi:7SK snRNA methylphosphate capping enzyme-like [Planococcus citri]|uniref:7SK snRNA methylphosphate capping enzyme-like n=1 Tax=Planococcus citri TaxID=170843 RepID=UPI0031F9555D
MSGETNSERNGKRKNTAPEKHHGKKPKTKPNFEFGNYNQYYGYRNINECVDPRIAAFHRRKELFENKDVLDIGCNIGHVTYIIARDLNPKSVLGIDIDNSLINIARKNRRHYCNNLSSTSTCVPNSVPESENSQKSSENGNVLMKKETDSPTPALSNESTIRCLQFPDNISFIHGNYVLDHDNLLDLEEPQYDVILCLSVTKWIQLNWGDDGLKRVFKRVYSQLRPGGVFILEAQPWESYRKKKLSAKLKSNCRDITFYPRMFKDYLLSEIGFLRNEILEIPNHNSKGFQRPIGLYYKR